MTLVANRADHIKSWEELIDAIGTDPETIGKTFGMAINAVQEARGEGRISDDDVELLLSEIIANLMLAKLDDLITSAFSFRLSSKIRFAPLIGPSPHRIMTTSM